MACDGYTCYDGACVPSRWVCDGDNDCSGGEDEQNCTPSGNQTIPVCYPRIWCNLKFSEKAISLNAIFCGPFL